MVQVLTWYFVIGLFGVLAFPVSFTIFSRLPDRGYSLSKPLGLLLAGLYSWWAGCLKILPFNRLSTLLAVFFLLLPGFLILIRAKPRQELLKWLKQTSSVKTIIAAELVFLLAFLYMVNTRAYIPDLNQSEKFFDLAFINSITTSTSLPPADPWFGGAYMNYYYGGLYLIGFLCKLTGTLASTGYNIAIGLVYGLLALVCFGVVANLVGLAKGKKLPAIGAGIIGSVFVALLGNLYPLRQVLNNGLLPFGDPSFPLGVNWPASARIIYDPMPNGKMQDVLTEYPIYSYLNGDLHEHMIAAPFVAMAISLVLNIFVTTERWALGALKWSGIPRFLASGMVFGSLYFINAGDFPTYLTLALVVLVFVELKAGGNWKNLIIRLVLQITALFICIWFVYIFQFATFNGMLKGEPAKNLAGIPLLGFLSRYMGWVSWPGTNLSEYLTMFGLFLWPVLSFLVLKIRQLWREEKRWPVMLIIEGFVSLVLIEVGWVTHIELLGPSLIIIYFPIRLLRREWRLAGNQSWQNRLDGFVLICISLAGLITLFCELLYIRDINNNRFNTVFKFWYQVWMLYGLMGVYCLWRVVTWFRTVTRNLENTEKEKTRFLTTLRVVRVARIAWLSILLFMVLFASALPTLAYWQGTNHYSQRQGLNGEAWYSREFPAEYKAMVWLRNYTSNQEANRGIVLELNAIDFCWANRVSTYTGLPTVVGWPYHELLWRSKLNELDIWLPWLDMTKIYETTDVKLAQDLLKKYNVRYVFVGQVENGSRSIYIDHHDYKKFSPEALFKFNTFMDTVYADPANNVYIYAFR